MVKLVKITEPNHGFFARIAQRPQSPFRADLYVDPRSTKNIRTPPGAASSEDVAPPGLKDSLGLEYIAFIIMVRPQWRKMTWDFQKPKNKNNDVQ
jgi:hypothetical protein